MPFQTKTPAASRSRPAKDDDLAIAASRTERDDLPSQIHRCGFRQVEAQRVHGWEYQPGGKLLALGCSGGAAQTSRTDGV